MFCSGVPRPGALLGPRLPPRAHLSGAEVGGQVQQKLFHWEETVTPGRDREIRGRGLSCPLVRGIGHSASGHCVLGLCHSRLPWPRGLVWGGF